MNTKFVKDIPIGSGVASDDLAWKVEKFVTEQPKRMRYQVPVLIGFWSDGGSIYGTIQSENIDGPWEPGPTGALSEADEAKALETLQRAATQRNNLEAARKQTASPKKKKTPMPPDWTPAQWRKLAKKNGLELQRDIGSDPFLCAAFGWPYPNRFTRKPGK